MALLAVGVGLAAWPLISYTYPNLFSQTPFGTWHVRPHTGVITPQLSTFIEDTLALENITGLSAAVVHKHSEAEFHAWGNRTEDGDEVTLDTLFHMGSVSKAFCATALGLLIEDFTTGDNVTALPSGLDELTWHTRLRDLLPEWQLMDAWASERANLRDILSHVSGLPRHDGSYEISETPQEMIPRLRYLRPAFELREQWSYNNMMYAVASHVVATYSGQPYESFVEERIFAPLGMTSSTFSPTKAEASGKFSQSWTRNGRRVPECFVDSGSVVAGPGGVISSAVDMVKWISTWINEGVYNNETVIPPSVYRNATFPYSIVEDHPSDPEHSISGYGMGWLRGSYRGHDIVSHSGSVIGQSTLVSFLPSDGIGVMLFVNGDGGALGMIMNRILDSALHLADSSTPTNPVPFGQTDAQPNPPLDTGAKMDEESPALSLDVFSGTYTNPGYGSLVLCGPSSSSSYCVKVQSDFSIIDNLQGNQSSSVDLLAEWTRACATHVRMRHQQGSKFEVYVTALFPSGYGKDTTPFETSGTDIPAGLVEFVVQDGGVIGFGLSGLIGRLTERARKHESVQDRAEVWFHKV